MTIEQFDNHSWKKGCKVVYKGKEYEVIEVYFNTRKILTTSGYLNCSEIKIAKPELKTDGKFLDGDAC